VKTTIAIDWREATAIRVGERIIKLPSNTRASFLMSLEPLVAGSDEKGVVTLRADSTEAYAAAGRLLCNKSSCTQKPPAKGAKDRKTLMTRLDQLKLGPNATTERICDPLLRRRITHVWMLMVGQTGQLSIPLTACLGQNDRKTLIEALQDIGAIEDDAEGD
jgi:hypothetical protein